MNTIKLSIPEHFLSALINGDDSGLDEYDQSALDAFIDDALKEFTTFHALSNTENLGFLKYHDLQAYGVLACDCATVSFDIGGIK